MNRCTVCTVLVSLVQCFAWTARAMYLLARGRTRTGVRTGNVPTCPCSYSYWYLLCSASLGQHGQYTYLPVVVLVLVSARVMYLLARVRTRTGTSCVPTCPWSYPPWYLLCSASLGQHGLCTYVPVLVSLYSVLLWVIRTMYISSCLDSRAVLVALLLLTWTVCW